MSHSKHCPHFRASNQDVTNFGHHTRKDVSATSRGMVVAYPPSRTAWCPDLLAVVLLIIVLLAAAQPASACSVLDPSCWFDETWDYFADLAEDAADLAWDVFTLDPKEAWEDFKDIANNAICGSLTPFSLAISNGVKADFDECASPPHPIAPPILAQLRLYFKSSFDSVRIHEGCTLDGDIVPGSRGAITFGEHIYFAPGAYHPQDDAGFALLAHELTHVLQYRKKGFGDFTCEYGLHCQFGANTGCAIEQQAYIYQALVLEDVGHPDGGDGIFTCTIGSPPSPDSEWNADNVSAHTCTSQPLLDNCPDVFNPDQENADGDAFGTACDSNPGSSSYWGGVGVHDENCAIPPPEVTCTGGQEWIPQDCGCGCMPGSSNTCSHDESWDEDTCSCKARY